MHHDASDLIRRVEARVLGCLEALSLQLDSPPSEAQNAGRDFVAKLLKQHIKSEKRCEARERRRSHDKVISDASCKQQGAELCPQAAQGASHVLTTLAADAIVAAQSHTLLSASAYVTQRDIYYAHTDIFPSQRALERAVAILGAGIGHGHAIARNDLHIVAGAKAVVVGNLRFVMASAPSTSTTGSGSHHDVDVTAHGTAGAAVTHWFCLGTRFQTTARAVVVVEKEATLLQLVAENVHQHAVLLCGKGYPCVAARGFLATLRRELPHLPFLCLVDSDAHGVAIFAEYLMCLMTPDLLAFTSEAGSKKRKRIGMSNCSCSAVAATSPPLPPTWSTVPLHWTGLRQLASRRSHLYLPSDVVRCATPANVARLVKLRQLFSKLPTCCTEKSEAWCEVRGWLDEVDFMIRERTEAELQALTCISPAPQSGSSKTLLSRFVLSGLFC